MANSLRTIKHYHDYLTEFDKLSTPDMKQIARYMCRIDLYFLIWWACGRHDIARQWLLDRCKEVESEPNGFLDLWARCHYKSTIITFGLTLQDILSSHGDDPLPKWNGTEPTIGIFSCTRPIAKGFLRQLKREFEGNNILRSLFPDIIWDNPFKDAPKWSEDDGLVLKRKSNPKESTIEAWGVVEAQPTSKHFFIRVYDDMVTLENVNSPNMIRKTDEAWEMSINLGMKNGISRYIGTRYHFNDTYRTMIARGAAKPRIYAATEDGTPAGKPVLLTPDELAENRRLMGPYTFSTQMLLDPKADETQGFKRDWIRFFNGSDGVGMNVYVIVDPANTKKQTSDYTAMIAVGLSEDKNYYVLDIVRDRLNLTQRGDFLFRIHKKWKPANVGYEDYGMQADITYLQDRMDRENYRFNITPLKGPLSKNDRIRKLIPEFEQGRIYLPNSCFKTNYEGITQDLVDVFLSEEYDAFPVPVHDDMLDALARILDPDFNALFPRIYEDEKPQRYQPKNRNGGSPWAA